MSATPFGRIFPPNTAWLAKLPAETVLEPELPIIDTHHHLWDRLPADLPGQPGSSAYLLEEFLADLRSGHNTVATVFMQCHTNYRDQSPEELRPVGETEFVAGIAAMTESGAYGVGKGIVGFADLTLGDRVTPVLEAHIAAAGGRFRGVRHSAGWVADPVIGNSLCRHEAASVRARRFPRRPGPAFRARVALDAWVFHPQLRRRDFSRARVFRAPTSSWAMWRPARLRPLCRQARRGLRAVEKIRDRAGALPERDDEARRHDDAARRLRLSQHAEPPSSAEMAALWRPYMETCIELFGADRCMFESNFPVEKMGTSWRRYGTRSNASPPAPPTARKKRCSTARRGGCIACNETGPFFRAGHWMETSSGTHADSTIASARDRHRARSRPAVPGDRAVRRSSRPR